MRKFKFRAWDSRNSEMVYSESTDCFYINTKGVLFMYAIPKSESGLETIYHKSYDVDQSTGLTDKNGVDIYEGDILEFKKGYVSVVRWNKGKLQFELSVNKSDFYDFAIMGKGTVIGNICENIDLLEK